MSNTDPIANMLVQIRNAQASSKEEITIAHSKLKEAILKILKEKGKIASVKTLIQKKRKYLVIKLAYQDKKPAISEVIRISKPGLRIYARGRSIPYSKTGQGVVILTTSQGILSSDQARKAGIGGEVICEIV